VAAAWLLALAAAAAGVTACGPAHAPAPASPSDGAGASSSGAAPSASLAEAEAELARKIREVVVAERSRLRACYEEGLARNPALAGRVVLVLEVGQAGTATRVFEARRDGLGEEEVRCFARVLRAAHFHDGAASAVRIEVPLAFAKDAAGQ